MEVLPTGRVGLLYYKPDSESPKAALGREAGLSGRQSAHMGSMGLREDKVKSKVGCRVEAGRSASPGRRRNEIRFQGHF